MELKRGVGQVLVDEVDSAASKWMKMISSAFLGGTSEKYSGRVVEEDAQASEIDEHNITSLKLAVVGGPGVGKTTIIKRWLKQPYPMAYIPTIGVDVHNTSYHYKLQDISLSIWDVSSCEVYSSSSSLLELICNDLDGIFFVFNVHNVNSIHALDKWRQAIAQFISPQKIPFILLAHKADLLQQRVMTSDDIDAYSQAAGYRDWKWTVGRAAFGENTKYPPVMDALDRSIRYAIAGKRSAQSVINPVLNAYLEEIANGDNLNEHQQQYLSSILNFSAIPVALIPTPNVEEHNLAVIFQNSVTAARIRIPSPGLKSFGGDWLIGIQRSTLVQVQNNELYNKISRTCSKQCLSGEEANDDTSVWKHYTGNIQRKFAEELLEGMEEGTFLLRRKDSQTLILSYVGCNQFNHTLIEYSNGKYYVGLSSKKRKTKEPNTTHVSTLTSLAKCLESVRKFAFNGLTFAQVQNRLLRPQDSYIYSQAEGGSNLSVLETGNSTDYVKSIPIYQQPLNEQRKLFLYEAQTNFYSNLNNQLESLKISEMSKKFDCSSKIDWCNNQAIINDLCQMAIIEKSTMQIEETENQAKPWRKIITAVEHWDRIVRMLNIILNRNPNGHGETQ